MTCLFIRYATGMVTEERGQNISDPSNWFMNIRLNLASAYLAAGQPTNNSKTKFGSQIQCLLDRRHHGLRCRCGHFILTQIVALFELEQSVQKVSDGLCIASSELRKYSMFVTVVM